MTTRLLTLLLLLTPSLAWAQAGFLQAVPGTTRPLCASIPLASRVPNQTWCADASGAPDTYLWSVWNGSVFVPVGSGGGGGTPASPIGSLQFNNTGVFGGARIFYAPAFGLSTSNIATANTTAMNAAIAAVNAAGGGTLLIPAGTFALNTTTALTVPAIIQGDNGTVLSLQPGQTAFTITTTRPVTVRGLTVTGGARAVLFQGGTNGTASIVEDNTFTGQTTAAVDYNSNGNQWTVRRNIIENTTSSGIRIGNATDSCECVIEGNSFALNTGVAAINWLGGGDLRIINNKFNARTTSIGEAIVRLHNQGVPTTEILIADNIFSNAAQGLLIDNPVIVGRINVTGNQFGSAFGDLVRFDAPGTTDLFLVGNAFTGAATPLVNLLQGARIFVESNHFLGNATNLTGINIDAAVLFASIGINKYSLPNPSTAVANASATTEFLPGLGAADEITVWSSDFLITSYTGFQWLHATRILNMDSTLSIVDPSGFDVSTAVLGSGNTTLSETGGSQQFVGALGAFNSTLHTSRVSALVAAEGSTIQNDSREAAIVGASVALIDNASRSAIVGGTGGTIGAVAINAVVLGGAGGTIDPGVTDAVALNGATVTANSTIGYKGYNTYTAVLFAALGTPANGTLVYCSDCATATPCAGAGTGAFALRLNGAWQCGGTTTGSGTANTLAKWTGSGTLGNSGTTDDGSVIVSSLPVTTPATIDIRRFGALGNGVADDTTAIQDVIDAAAATGAEILCSPGDYKITAELVVTPPLKIRGTTGNVPAVLGDPGKGCRIVAATNTQHVFVINTTTATNFYTLLDGVATIEDVVIDASVVKTAGAGVFITNSSTGCTSADLTRLTIMNQWDGVSMDNGCGVTLSNNRIEKFLNIGAHFQSDNAPDGGNYMLSGNIIGSIEGGVDTAIEWVSGGDLFVINNVLASTGANVVRVNAANGVSTSQVSITGNEIESGSGSSVLIATTGTGTLARVAIANNVLTASGDGITLAPNTSANLFEVSITGNSLGADTCFVITGGNKVTLAGNSCGYGVNGVNVGASAGIVNIGVNTLDGPAPVYVVANTTTAINGTATAIFTGLPAAADGSMIYCTDCDPTATLLACTHVGAQTGAFAFRVNGAWKCMG